MPQISVCIIVKNEEDVVARALLSVREIAAEVIVVDTGSTDATIEIARALGAKVYSFPWCDDFAAARNFSVDKASADWLLVIDADEVIDAKDLPKLSALTAEPTCCYELIQRHYTNDTRIQGFVSASGDDPSLERGAAGYFETRCVRLFPRRTDLRFCGRVHELVEPSIPKSLPPLRIINSGVRLHHYGHMRGVERARAKRALYASLAARKAHEGGDKWRSFYELGVERLGALEFGAAIGAFEESVRLNPAFVLSWVNLGFALCEEGRHEHARRALLRALSLDPACIEAYCNLGVVFMRLERHAEAIESFFEALALDESYLPAYSNLGKVYLRLNRLKEAGGCFLRATELNPHCAELRTDLAQVYLLAGSTEHSELHLQEALQTDERQFKAHYLLAQLRKAQGDLRSAAAHLKRTCQLLDESGLAQRPAERLLYEQALNELKQCDPL